MAIQEIWMPSPHYSTSRGAYNKAVLHTTEGAMKIRDLGAWFANPSAQCSSHHGADNYERGPRRLRLREPQRVDAGERERGACPWSSAPTPRGPGIPG